MRAVRAIAPIVVAGAIAAACGADDLHSTTTPAVADSVTPTTATETAGPGTAPSTTPPASGPVRWRLIDTIDGVFAPGDTTAFVAVNDAQWQAIWLGIGYPGDRPVIDFADEIVVVWAYGVSGSCDQDSLDDVVLAGNTVAPVFSSPYEPGTTCTADFNPRARIVAIGRESLPEVPFDVQADRVPCDGCSVTVTDVSGTAPAVIPLTPEDLAQIVVAAVELRASIIAADPAVPIEIIDTVGRAGVDGSIDYDGGIAFDEATRILLSGITASEVRFVPPMVVTETRGDTAYVVVGLAAPAVLDGHLTITSSVWCGTLCAHTGANKLIVDAQRTWSIGEPIGPQTVA